MLVILVWQSCSVILGTKILLPAELWFKKSYDLINYDALLI